MTTTDMPEDHPVAVLVRELGEMVDAPDKAGNLAQLLRVKGKLRALIASTAVSCLGAGRFVYEREGARKGWRELPDFATRLKACEFLRDTMDGRPVQAALNLNADAGPGRLNAGDLLAADEGAERMLLDLAAKMRAARAGRLTPTGPHR